jgi:uncharacterized protein YbcI
MPDPAGAPDPPRTRTEGVSLLSSISREIVYAMKTYFGKGPETVKSYFADDLLFVVMRGGLTRAEETMLAADRENLVREFRQQFENEMADRLVGTIEQLTERKVVNYQSQVMFDPDVIVEMFVFDQPVSEQARRETAEALLNPEAGIGRVDEGDGEGTQERDD